MTPAMTCANRRMGSRTTSRSTSSLQNVKNKGFLYQKRARTRLSAVDPSREQFNAVQEAFFSEEREVKRLTKKEPPIIQARLHEIVQSALPLPESPRVMDVGCGTGCLVPHFREAGINDILCNELAEPMLAALRDKFPESSTEGNTPGVRVWHGDFVDVPRYMGPFDVIFFNAVFGNLYSVRDALTKGKIVVSHPLGRKWHCALAERSPATVPHVHPTLEQWQELLFDLPLAVTEFRNEDKLYIAVLQVPDGYAFPGSPIFLQGEVIVGRGIGSAELGVPTANLKPDSFQEQLSGQPKGVYFGWVQRSDSGSKDVYGAVFNLGNCPTMKGDAEEVSLEAHILHRFDESFYGETLRVALLGFLRPEMKFSGVSELLKQIHTDISISKNQLKAAQCLEIQQDSFFAHP